MRLNTAAVLYKTNNERIFISEWVYFGLTHSLSLCTESTLALIQKTNQPFRFFSLSIKKELSQKVFIQKWKSVPLMERLWFLLSDHLSGRTLGVAEVSWRKQVVDVNQGEHGERTNQWAHLSGCSTPDQGAVAVVSQDDSHHHFNVWQRPGEKEPRQHLARTREHLALKLISH